jgi:hypothetical protein
MTLKWAEFTKCDVTSVAVLGLQIFSYQQLIYPKKPRGTTPPLKSPCHFAFTSVEKQEG